MRRKGYSGLFKRVLSLGLVATMTMGLAACGDDDKDKNASGKSYTYNTFMEASPLCWNAHSWITNADDYISRYCEIGLVDVQIGEDGSWEWVYEMADSITDVTADFKDKEKWGIGAEETGRVWEIKLNKDACWEDGTVINADSYVNSLKLLLDPEMKNRRANLYYDPNQSDTAIVGALGYYNNDKVGKAIYTTLASKGYKTVEDALAAGVNAEDILVNVTGAFGIECDTETGYIGYQDTAVELIDEKGLLGTEGASVTGKALYDACFAPGTTYAEHVANYVYVPSGEVYEETPFEEVGLIKVDDYTLYYITAASTSEFYFNVSMMSNWLVHEDTYNAGKSDASGLVTTNYGTSVDTYKSYGPYKLVSFEKDKQFVMEKNENWYGYKDGEHENQFQTTKLVVNIIPDHSTALQMFLSGQLDEVALDVNDMETYRMSDYLYQIDQTYTLRWIFATELDALIKLEDEANDGGNKRVLHYDDFRKAMSLAMDRDTFNSEATPGYSSAYYLINYVYYTDIENDHNSLYRNSDEAMKVVLDLYGIEYENNSESIKAAYDKVTGYDLEEARALFQSVYEQAKADGNYTDGQEIKINCMVSSASSLSAQDIAQQDALNRMLGEATKGTGFEGKITIKFESGAANRYQDCAEGKKEMIRGAWGGAAFYPFSMIGSYTNPAYAGTIHESCGWDPTTETLDITYDFDGDGTEETLTKTFEKWTLELNDNNVYGLADNALRTHILAALEKGVLETYQCIPWGTETVSTLYSQKVQNGTDEYNIMYDFGGIRHMTYNYDDKAWTEYVKEQGGVLNYE